MSPVSSVVKIFLARERIMTCTTFLGRGRLVGGMSLALAMSAVVLAPTATVAQRGGRGQAAPPPTPKAAAPIDLTGYWVSVVTEDWRWRMITPPKGDFASVPVNNEGRKVADGWDPAKAASDGCKAFGAAGIMRMPGRVHVTWESDNVLKIETDAGRQARLLLFDKSQKPSGERTWQGHSVAEWEIPGGRGGAPAPGGESLGAGRGSQTRDGTLKVMTTNLLPGYLRKNGVPYSENAVVSEYFDRHAAYDTEWFTVTTLVDDPQYLTQPFITSTHFKREPDGANWSPTPCE